MTNATDIMRAVLFDLAENGNEKAKFTLSIVDKMENANNADAIRTQLRLANDNLSQAVQYNGVEWTSATDRAIERARAHLFKAIGLV